MRAGRWYPTNTSLPNGEMLTISGLHESERSNPIPEVWRVGGGWRVLSGARRIMANYPWMLVAPNVTTPASRNLVPPGHYLLFIPNGNGVPSVGRIVQIS